MSLNFWQLHKGINFRPQTSAPVSPSEGDVYYDNTLLKLRCYQNGAWVNLSDTDGTVLLDDGSAGSPSLAFTNDTNTGLYRDATYPLKIAIDGVDFGVFTNEAETKRLILGDWSYDIGTSARLRVIDNRTNNNLVAAAIRGEGINSYDGSVTTQSIGVWATTERNITNSQADSGNGFSTPFSATNYYSVPSGKTLANTSTLDAGLSLAMSKVGTGTLNLDVFQFIRIAGNSVASGTNKIGINIGPMSGATNNALLTDNATFTGNYGIHLTTTNPSYFANRLMIGSTSATVLSSTEKFTCFKNYDGVLSNNQTCGGFVADISTTDAVTRPITGLEVWARRVATGNCTDGSLAGNGRHAALHTYSRFNINSISTWNSSTWSTLCVGGVANDNTGTININSYNAFEITPDSVATGGTRRGIRIGTISGGTSSNWQIYSDGTSPSYFAGRMGIGNIGTVGDGLYVASTNLTGTTQNGLFVAPIGASDATVSVRGIVSAPYTTNASFTTALLTAFMALDNPKGAASTVTRHRMYYGAPPTQGDTIGGGGNAWGADNATFVGDYVLHFTSTRPSYFAGPIQHSDGTAAAPSITFGSDINTGLYRPGSDVVGISSGGLAALSIGSASGSRYIQFENTSTGVGNIFNGVADGYVGIIGGTGPANSGQINLYGAAHGSKPAWLEFKQNTTIVGSIAANGLWTLGASGGTQTHVVNGQLLTTSYVGIGAVDSSKAFAISGTGLITGLNVASGSFDATAPIGATASVVGVRARVRTSAATALGFAFEALQAVVTGAPTILVNYYGSNLTSGTNNAFIADNQSFTGNWFINSSTTNPSHFSGPMDWDQIATPSNPASGSNRVYFKSDGNLYKLSSAGVETVLGGDINNGGNSFGSAMTIGTNDANALNLETSNTTRMTLNSTGEIYSPSTIWFGNNSSLIGAQVEVYKNPGADATSQALYARGSNNFDGVVGQTTMGFFGETVRSLTGVTSRTDTQAHLAAQFRTQWIVTNSGIVLTHNGTRATRTVDIAPAVLSGAGSLALLDFVKLNIQTDAVLTGTNKYGIYMGTMSGATNNWQLYIAGTSPSYHAGALRIGTGSVQGAATEKFTVVTPYSGTSTDAHYGSFGLLDINTGDSLSATQVNHMYWYRRTVAASSAVVETTSGGAGFNMNLRLGSSFLVPSTSSYTYADSEGFAELAIRDMLVTGGGGTLAITHYKKIFITADAVATGTNKYGLYIDSQSGATNNWQIYSPGTAPSYFAGRMGIGNTGTVGDGLYIAPTNLTGTTQNGLYVAPIGASDATVGVRGVVSTPITTNASFTTGLLTAFMALDSPKGALSTVTRHRMYYGAPPTQGDTIGGGGNAWGSDNATFVGDYVLHFTSTRPSYFAGAVRIGAAATIIGGDELLTLQTAYGAGTEAQANIGIANQIILNSNSPYTVNSNSAITARLRRNITTSVTDTSNYNSSISATCRFNVAALQTLTNAGSDAWNGIIVYGPSNDGAGALNLYSYAGVNIQGSSLNTGTNKFGLYIGPQAGAASNWQLYSAGTSPSYFAGPVRIGRTTVLGGTEELTVQQTTSDFTVSSIGSAIQNTISGNTAFTGSGAAGVYAWLYRGLTGDVTDTTGTLGMAAISAKAYFGGAFTYTNATTRGVSGVFVSPPTSTASVLAISQYSGIYIDSSSLNTGTNKYGIFIGDQSGATNNWQLYSNGTSPSYFAGPMGIAGTTDASSFLTLGVSNPLTTVRQRAIYVNFTVSSLANVSAGGSRFDIAVASGTVLPLLYGYNCSAFTKGTATVDRAISADLTPQTIGSTGNATIADNETFTGNWAINLNTTNPSSFHGAVCTLKNDIASTASITALDSVHSFVKLTGSTATTIHGITAGKDGQRLVLFNNSGQILTIKYQSGTAAAADQITTMTGADIVTVGNGAAEFIYDVTDSKWICLYVSP